MTERSCATCRHVRRGPDSGLAYARCVNPQAQTSAKRAVFGSGPVSPEDGGFVQLLRWPKEACGPEGRLWEPSEALPPPVVPPIASAPRPLTLWGRLKIWLYDRLG